MIKTKQQTSTLQPGLDRQNPYQGQHTAKAQTVGGTIGERRAIQQFQGPAGWPALARDKSSFEAKRPGNLAEFGAGDTFNAAKRFSVSGRPYVRPIVDRTENGTARNSLRPTDDRILNFLTKVIETPYLQNRNAVRKAAFQGKPAQTANSNVKINGAKASPARVKQR